MKPWTRKIAFSFCMIAGISSLLVWYRIHHRAVDPGVEQGVRRIAKQNPTIQMMLDRATDDGVLTMAEANAIIDEAEKLNVTNAPKDPNLPAVTN